MFNSLKSIYLPRRNGSLKAYFIQLTRGHSPAGTSRFWRSTSRDSERNILYLCFCMLNKNISFFNTLHTKYSAGYNILLRQIQHQWNGICSPIFFNFPTKLPTKKSSRMFTGWQFSLALLTGHALYCQISLLYTLILGVPYLLKCHMVHLHRITNI